MQPSPGRGDAKSSAVRYGSEPHDPNKCAPQPQPSADDAVAMFMPGCDATERALRVRIYRARDVATARGTRSKHGAARALFWQAAQIAEMRVFARIAEDDLRETIDNLARLFLVAGWIERTEAADVG